MSKPDCELGFGYNAKLKISDIANRAPEYLRILYNDEKTPSEIKEVMKHYVIEKEKPMAKAKEKTETVENVENLSLLKKINLIRKACSEKCIEKEGKGKAGGGSKYDYYKAQQIIDFYLDEEIKYDLFSEFKVTNTEASYRVIDIPTGETASIECPFDIPRKMAASEAQQVGAALTYFNRRLAMMMYKIEDNSKESMDVLDDADFSTKEIPAPIIPAPPVIIPPPTNIVAPPTPPTAKVNNPIESEQNANKDANNSAQEQKVEAQEEVKSEAIETPPIKKNVPPVPPTPPIVKNTTGLANGQIPYLDPRNAMSQPKRSIEDLYN